MSNRIFPISTAWEAALSYASYSAELMTPALASNSRDLERTMVMVHDSTTLHGPCSPACTPWVRGHYKDLHSHELLFKVMLGFFSIQAWLLVLKLSHLFEWSPHGSHWGYTFSPSFIFFVLYNGTLNAPVYVATSMCVLTLMLVGIGTCGRHNSVGGPNALCSLMSFSWLSYRWKGFCECS